MQFLKILMVSDKTIDKVLEFIKLYKQNLSEDFFFLNYLLKLYICFNRAYYGLFVCKI